MTDDREPPPAGQPPPPQPKSRSAIIAAGCLLAATALTIPSEGIVLHPYYDPAKVLTWCAGETQGKPKAAYSEAECRALLQNRQARDYAPAVAECAGEAVRPDRVKIFAALVDAAYNVGPPRLCRSPMVARLKADDLRGTCGAFTAKTKIGPLLTQGWMVTARYRGKPQPAAAMRAHRWTWDGKAWRKQLPGLVTRRINEAALCFKGI